MLRLQELLMSDAKWTKREERTAVKAGWTHWSYSRRLSRSAPSLETGGEGPGRAFSFEIVGMELGSHAPVGGKLAVRPWWTSVMKREARRGFRRERRSFSNRTEKRKSARAAWVPAGRKSGRDSWPRKAHSYGQEGIGDERWKIRRFGIRGSR
jgi:hypothetical protein